MALLRRGAGLARRLRDRLRDRRFGVGTNVATATPVVALTFDDGPDPSTTPQLLALLERHDARATFFMIGGRARAHTDLVEQVRRRGHVTANHAFDHVSLVGLGAKRVTQQVLACREALGGDDGGLVRPPYGHMDATVVRAIERLGATLVDWSGHAYDWEAHDETTYARHLRSAIAPGAIVLLHDAPQPFEATAATPRAPLFGALDQVLSDLAPSVDFVTVPELLRHGRLVKRARFRGPATA